MKTRRLVRYCLTLAVGSAAILGVAVSPPLREALIAVEPLLATLIFFAALVGAGLSWRARGQADGGHCWRRREALLGRFLDRWGWTFAVLAMLAPLWSHWALKPPGGTTALAALFGRLPWSDALGHYEGGVRLLCDGAFGPYSERRPLNAAWLAVRLAAGSGSLPFALVSQAVLLGLVASVFCRTVGVRFGLWPALAAFGLVQGLTRDGIPTAATEPLGVTLGCAALTLLISRRARSHLGWMALALFGLDVALNARPGPQLLILAFLLWGVWLFRKQWVRAAIVLFSAWMLSAATTHAVNGLYGAGQSSFWSYPAYTLYGLTRDSNYKQAQHDYGTQIAELPSEREVARFLYARAFDALRREPGLFLRALFDNELKFFEKLGANLSRLVTIQAFFTSEAERARPPIAERYANVLLGLPLLLVAAGASFLRILRTKEAADRLFWVASGVGILGSVPFVYGDAGFRGLAVAYPFIAVFLALGLGHRDSLRPRAVELPLVQAAVATTAGVALLALLVPGVVHRFWPQPSAELRLGLRPGTTLLVDVTQSPAVLVSRSRRANLPDVPWIDERAYAELLELADLPEDFGLATLKLPFSLATVYDHVTRRAYLLVGTVDLLRQRGFVRVDVDAIGQGAVVRDRRLAPGATEAAASGTGR